MAIFYTPNCQTEVGGHIVYVKGIPMLSLLAKSLGTGDNDFYTCQYGLCNINFPVISTQNRRGRRIAIPGGECI